MKLQSIRWQLPISYAAIAMIATLCLGVVLLTVLNSHYARLERETLHVRAQNVSGYLSRVLGHDDIRLSRIADQIQSFSFLTNTRIVVDDDEGNTIVDTGSPIGAYISVPERDEQPLPPPRWWEATPSDPPMITIVRQEDINTFDAIGSLSTMTTSGIPSEDFLYSGAVVGEGQRFDGDFTFFTAAPLPYGGFDVVQNGEMTLEYVPRSDQTVSVDIRDREDNFLGTINMLEGPAFGQDILNSVAQGWLLAGVVAVLLAGVAGWLVSLRITEPLIDITRATQRMTEGNLAARTEVQRGDELGVLANAFNAMASQIESTVTMLRRFAADAAHELNTPLTALRTNLELALESPNPESNRRALEQLSRLETLADDLLDLSRIETMPERRKQEPVDVVALIRETSVVYASRAEQAEIEFELALPDQPVTINADPNQLRRLLSNLLDNAIKFTPPEGYVAVHLERDHTFVKVCVEDTGIGIPEENLPQLFSRFHRGRNAHMYPGSGLGLAIVKAIVDAHQGQVYAESNGDGTRITARLPLST